MQIFRRRGLTSLCPFSSAFYSTLIDNTKQATQLNATNTPSEKIHKIKSLLSVIQQRNRLNIRSLFDENSDEIFVYGMHPEKFNLQYFVYMKYGYWQHNTLNSQKLNKFIEQLMKRDSECQKDEEKNLKQIQIIHQYRTSLAVELLPSVASQLEYSHLYILNLNAFLRRHKKLKQIQISLILVNFDRVVFKSSTAKHFENDKDNAWLLLETFNLFLDHTIPYFQSISVTSKTSIILIARNLRVNHLPLMQYLRRYVQEGRKQLSLQVFLSAILFLGSNRSFPYEYFYRDKDSLMNFIESAEALSDKKVSSSLILLQIFARNNLPYCEKILDRLLSSLEQNLPACDVGQLVRIFYFYSRLRSSPSYRFLQLLIERLSIFLDSLEQKHYQLIVKALAALNYVDLTFLKKLQQYDYELFFASLRYGCEHIGPYYSAILQQVEQNYRKDPVRSYSAEDKPFFQLQQPVA